MKKFVVLFLTMALVAAFAVPGLATVVGSKHDFTSAQYTGSTITSVTNQKDEVCKACHVPHNAISKVGTYDVSGILWAKDYTLGTITGQTLAVRNSVLCMSCHDGVIADNADTSATKPTYSITTTANLGNDLSNDHPIDIAYPADTTNFVANAGDLPLYATIAGVAGNVACQSCHDVHGKKAAATDTTDIPNFLRVKNTGSALCLKCHIK